MIRKTVVILLLVSALLLAQIPPKQVRGQGDSSILYVSPLQISSDSFSVNIRLNLSATEVINGYEILLNYSSYVLTATSIQLGDLFSLSQVLEVVSCVNGGVGIPQSQPGNRGCTVDDGPGIVHSEAVGENVTGPVSRILFSVHFNKVGNGTSVLQLSRDAGIRITLVNPGQGYINPHPILHLTLDGIFANQGVAAFFNASPAILIAGQPVFFDASGSFNPNGRSITSYRWNFGDGTGEIDNVPTTSHRYSAPGQYNAKLVVTDAGGSTGNITRPVAIGSALGNIHLYVRDATGNRIPLNVTASLYNGTILVSNQTKLATSNLVFFSNLTAGTYRIDLRGVGIVPMSKVENVMTGWTTWDIAYLSYQKQPSTFDWSPIIFLGTLAAGLLIAGIGLYRRRRRIQRDRQNHQRAKG